MYIIHKNITFVFNYIILNFLDTGVLLVGKSPKIIKFEIFDLFWNCTNVWGKCPISCWKWVIWNYLILNITGKIRNIFENYTECEHDNIWKFWEKNKWKLSHTETFKCLVWAVSNMDNARKKYVNIERLSSGDIFALFDSIENNDEGDIENRMILIQNL